MYRYYLTPPTATGVDTVFVVDAGDTGSAAYLMRRLGCERITRREAYRVDRTHRLTGRGSAWARPQGLTRQVDGMLAADASDLARAAEATLEMVAFYRENDAADDDADAGACRFVTITIDDSDRMTVQLADVDDHGNENVVSRSTSDQPGVWAAVRTDRDLWTWAESRDLCPPCEHSSPGRFARRNRRETFAVHGPVS